MGGLIEFDMSLCMILEIGALVSALNAVEIIRKKSSGTLFSISAEIAMKSLMPRALLGRG